MHRRSHFFFSILLNNCPYSLFLYPTFQLPNLEKHKLTHDPNAKPKHGNSTKTVCNICHKNFGNNMALRGHMKKHKEKTASFRCPVCKKRFQMAEVMVIDSSGCRWHQLFIYELMTIGWCNISLYCAAVDVPQGPIDLKWSCNSWLWA